MRLLQVDAAQLLISGVDILSVDDLVLISGRIGDLAARGFKALRTVAAVRLADGRR